jgi:hypothetical protein
MDSYCSARPVSTHSIGKRLILAWVMIAAGPLLYGDELPLPQLIPHLAQFRLEACAAPQAAFDRYADPATAAKLRQLGPVLCPASDPSRGWQFFFGTSVASVTSLSEKMVLTMLYNPWADVALLCEWTNPGPSPRMTDVELVTGDILRNTKQPQLTPLWRREGDVPPSLAVMVATSDTTGAFLSLYGKRAMWGGENWQKKLPNLKKTDQVEGNKMAVGVLFSQALSAIHTFFNEPAFESLKTSMDQVRKQLIDGRTEEVLAGAPETTMENRAILTEVPLEWKKATLVSVAVNAKNGFVFLTSFENPEVFASFWFNMTETGAASLRRIDCAGFTLGFDEINALARQAGMKRS